MEKDIVQHIMSRVTKAPGGCWLSEWCKGRNGYSQIWHRGSMQQVHRVIFQEMVAPLIPGLQIDHICNVRHCCNPDHLEQVTAAENVARSWKATPERDCAPPKKTHCLRGHEFTYRDIMPSGVKRCRLCENERRQERYRSDPEYRAKAQRKAA